MNFQTSLTGNELLSTMLDLGASARAAASSLSKASKNDRTAALRAMAKRVREAAPDILAANADDMRLAERKDLSDSMLDRLLLDEERVEAIAKGLDAVAELNDPVGDVLETWERPNGLRISRVRGPIGVIGIIYESRPNVTADAGALCVRSGNVAILRGGSESKYTSTVIARALQDGLEDAGLPADAIQLVPTTDREAVGIMLSGLDGQLDVVVPRGGKSLVARVQQEARVPVIGHLEGLVHMYVDRDADQDKAIELVLNSKLRRTGVCGALETLLIDSEIAADFLPRIVDALRMSECEIRADQRARDIVPDLEAASAEDWVTEYLDKILSIKIVDGVVGAIDHIEEYGSGHTESIVTENEDLAQRFLDEVDASIVMQNASTQFADGGEFGMGAEIGIATGRIHARGPVGADQLTIFKYVVKGTGQTRA